MSVRPFREELLVEAGEVVEGGGGLGASSTGVSPQQLHHATPFVLAQH